jgi:acetoacetyl-CoA synthetase
MTAYMGWLEGHLGLSFEDYGELWSWSVADTDAFWQSIWDYFEVISSGSAGSVTDGAPMPGTRWFEGTELNYAEHIFRNRREGDPAILAASEQRPLRTITWGELRRQVASVPVTAWPPTFPTPRRRWSPFWLP